MSKKKRIGYYTNWWLSDGILKLSFEQRAGGWVSVGGCYRWLCANVGVNLFWTRPEAEARVKELAKKKLASLEKQRLKVTRLLDCPKWAKSDGS